MTRVPATLQKVFLECALGEGRQRREGQQSRWFSLSRRFLALFFPTMVHADPILSIARCPRMVFQAGLQ